MRNNEALAWLWHRVRQARIADGERAHTHTRTEAHMGRHTGASGLARTPALALALAVHAHTPAPPPAYYVHTDVRYADPLPNACDGREHGRGMRSRVRRTSMLVVRRAHRDWRTYA